MEEEAGEWALLGRGTWEEKKEPPRFLVKDYCTGKEGGGSLVLGNF